MQRGDPQKVPSLVLHSTDAQFVPASSKQFIDTLKTCGFLGANWTEHRYLIGDQFLDLVTFLGCSPHIDVAPLDDANDLRFCHIHIPPPETTPTLLASRLAPAPRCPRCRSPLTGHHSDMSLDGMTELLCASCGHMDQALNWRWRPKQACVTHFAIHIVNIFDSEAVPAEHLMDTLRAIEDVSWSYCYIMP